MREAGSQVKDVPGRAGALFLVAVSLFSLLLGRSDCRADELDIARRALGDGLYEVARMHAAKVLTNDTAKLVMLESYADERRWEEVKKTLDGFGKSASGAAFDYYRAVVKGDLETAAKLLGRSGSVAGEASARMMLADLAEEKGGLGKARELWRAVVADTNAPAIAYATAAIRLSDAAALRRASSLRLDPDFKRRIALCLGTVLVGTPSTEQEGERLVREVVRDSPDTPGAAEAYLRLAAAESAGGKWETALKTFNDAIEIWPVVAKRARLRLGRGDALRRLNRNNEALSDFCLAETLADEDIVKAEALFRQGDVLSELGRGEEALARYRQVLSKYPKTEVAQLLEKVVKVRELESRGRALYNEYRFDEAAKIFDEVATMDPSRAARMAHYRLLCLYGLGRDEEARSGAVELVASTKDAAVCADVMLWLGKYAYNLGEWKEALGRFVAFVDVNPKHASAPAALLWAVRAAVFAGDSQQVIRLSTRLSTEYPEASEVPSVLIIQSETLIELARYGEAVLVLEKVSVSDKTTRDDRLRARLLRADAFFAMGTDNQARYTSALEAYRQVWLEAELSPSMRLVVAFKIARVLDKLKRHGESNDFYYTQVVRAYRDGRERGEEFDDDAKAAFSKAVFQLADEYEERNRVVQAISILELLAFSDVPASKEAIRRIERLSTKGRFL